jgi:pimeloyl-ACP methyl ester carboxylesterase
VNAQAKKAGCTISKSSAFKKKPIPWMYSTVGCMLATAVIKLNPIHRRLSELEVANIRDFFNSDFLPPARRRQLNGLSAFLMTYVQAIRRMTKMTRQARQDYYALQRQGCFVVDPASELPVSSGSAHTPILIIPGLNTPAVFFREMHAYFTDKGYCVAVMNLPANGFADISASAEALREEVERLRQASGSNQVNIIGHCLGGLIAHYWLETVDQARQAPGVRNLISLGTGFLGAEGVQQLKNLWIPRNPGKPIPGVFDELIQANMNIIRHSTGVARHNLLTVWDFMVHFRKALLEPSSEQPHLVANHIIEDPAIDHLTIVLNHSVFQRLESILSVDAGGPDLRDVKATLPQMI